MVKKQSTSTSTSIRKRKNLFIGVGMRVDFTFEDYKQYSKILENYTKSNNWKLKKEKIDNEGYSIMINPKLPNLSAEEVLIFIKKIDSMLNDIQEKMGEEELVYPDDYTNIKYYDIGSEENFLLGIHRFSEMMIINITSKNAMQLHNEDPEMAQNIFGNYGVDGDKFLNVRLAYDDLSESIFSKIKNIFFRN